VNLNALKIRCLSKLTCYPFSYVASGNMLFRVNGGCVASVAVLSGLQKSNERPSMFRMDARIQKACIMHYDVAGGESNSEAPRHPYIE
jgi:hypothetical protein